jgi:predicted LPLAT superfamily acyltransferase
VRVVGRVIGRDLCYLFILPPVIWLFVRDAAARRASVDYWRRIRPDLGRWGRLVMAFLHYWAFGRRLADRLLVRAVPGAIGFRSSSEHRLQAAMASPAGCVVLSAHVGSWELSGRWMTAYRHQGINLVMLGAEDPRVQEQVRKAMGETPYAIIDLVDPVRASLEIAARLRAGQTCCMLGDRTAGDGANTVRVPFLGAPAAFPIGPFVAAAATGAPLVMTFCLAAGDGRYRTVAFGPFRIELGPRRTRMLRLHRWVDRWARMLEAVARRHPHQWANFYDFWR